MAEPIAQPTVVPLNPAEAQGKEGVVAGSDDAHSALEQNRSACDLIPDQVGIRSPNRLSGQLHAPTIPGDHRASSNEQPSFDDLIQHDLNDVYLLLDHLSGRADRNIASIELEHRDKSGQKLNLIDAVCQIKWPDSQQQARSEQAAILFKARDIQ
jgi:hypothetical protein